ncbi:MAG: hypothetical protein JWQ71_4400 [Pedosphaera sp.]|nr:hypothetical protein [Pedosphaera sp.]
MPQRNGAPFLSIPGAGQNTSFGEAIAFWAGAKNRQAVPSLTGPAKDKW